MQKRIREEESELEKFNWLLKLCAEEPHSPRYRLHYKHRDIIRKILENTRDKKKDDIVTSLSKLTKSMKVIINHGTQPNPIQNSDTIEKLKKMKVDFNLFSSQIRDMIWSSQDVVEKRIKPNSQQVPLAEFFAEFTLPTVEMSVGVNHVGVNQTTPPTNNVPPPPPVASTQQHSLQLPEEVSKKLKEIEDMYKSDLKVGAHLLCIDERTIFKNELGKKNTRIGGYTNAIKTFIEYLSQKHNGKKGEELLAACPALRCLVHSTSNAIVTTCGIHWQRRSGVVSLKNMAKLATSLNWNVTFACEPDPRPQKTNTLVNIYITTSGK